VDIHEHIRALNEKRARIHADQVRYIDDAAARHPGESFSAEEREYMARQDADIAALEGEIREFSERAKREVESGREREVFERQYGSHGVKVQERTEAQRYSDFFSGRSHDFVTDDPHTPGRQVRGVGIDIEPARRMKELLRNGSTAEEARSLLWDTGSIGSGVPTMMANELYAYLEASIAAFRLPTTMITTSTGAPMEFPRNATLGAGTQVIAQGTAIGGTNPTFAKMTLNAFKYGQLVQVSSETIADTAFNSVSYILRQIAYNVGRDIDRELVAGTGTNEPNGMMVAPTISANTGGSLINPTYESLVDLQHAVVDGYRNGNAAWLMRDATAAVIRKLRDGAGGTVGAPLWQPNTSFGITAGVPGQLLGFPVYTDPNVASLASDARVIAFGDWSTYYVRTVGNLVIERSDEFAFNTDLVTFRGKWRIDGDLIDTNAIAVQRRNV
jgi:HK97 family phage major capsid protein